MSVLLILIFASLIIAGVFLGCFFWAVNSGQFEDTCTPSMRVLLEETASPQSIRATGDEPVPAPSARSKKPMGTEPQK